MVPKGNNHGAKRQDRRTYVGGWMDGWVGTSAGTYMRKRVGLHMCVSAICGWSDKLAQTDHITCYGKTKGARGEPGLRYVDGVHAQKCRRCPQQIYHHGKPRHICGKYPKRYKWRSADEHRSTEIKNKTRERQPNPTRLAYLCTRGIKRSRKLGRHRLGNPLHQDHPFKNPLSYCSLPG